MKPMNTKLKATLTSLAISALPLLALAQGTPTFTGTIDKVSIGLNRIIVFLILVATVVFLYGIVKYITAGGDEEKVKEGRTLIINGVIFLAVMIALWGLVSIVLTFVFGTSSPFNIPGGTDVPRQEGGSGPGPGPGPGPIQT